MVAYSFQKRFAPMIEAGLKTHTIRGERKRHARVGERLQLYRGMRTKYCAKIISDPICNLVEPIHIRFAADSGLILSINLFDEEMPDLDAFAISDGFDDAAEMARFWATQHGQMDEFCGWLIGWLPK